MRKTAVVAVMASTLLAACSADQGFAPDAVIAPQHPSLSEFADGNPPPPRVLGRLSFSLTTTSTLAGRANTTYRFAGPAHFNRNLTTGMNFLEMASGPGKIRANATQVFVATGVVTLVDNTSGAQVAVDLGQFAGFAGKLFVACPSGSTANCFDFSQTVTGIITPTMGQPFAASGLARFRWESN